MAFYQINIGEAFSIILVDGTPCHFPMLTDYSDYGLLLPQTTSYGSISMSGKSTNTYYAVAITDLSLIKTSGYTQIGFRGTQDVNNVPPSDDHTAWAAIDSYGSSYPVYLKVTYTSAGPTYSNIGASPNIAGQSCTFHSNWTDAVGLSKYIFSTNNTGVWVNDTAVAFPSTPGWANVTKTLTSNIGQVVGYRW